MVNVILTAEGEPFNHNVGRYFSRVGPDKLLNRILRALHNSCVDIGRRRTYLGCHSFIQRCKIWSWGVLTRPHRAECGRSRQILFMFRMERVTCEFAWALMCARSHWHALPVGENRQGQWTEMCFSRLHRHSTGCDLRHTSKEIFKPLKQHNNTDTAKRTKRWFLL